MTELRGRPLALLLDFEIVLFVEWLLGAFPEVLEVVFPAGFPVAGLLLAGLLGSSTMSVGAGVCL